VSVPLPRPAVSFAEIRNLVLHLPRLEPVVLPDLPPCGKLADWIAWLARAQGRKPEVRHMRLALFAGAHGCAANSTEKTREKLEILTQGTSPLARIVGEADADLRVYELDLATPTADFGISPALTEEEAAHAMAYGMMAVEPGVQLLALAGFGTGGELAHKALTDAVRESDTPLETLARFGGREVCAIVGAILAARLAKMPVLLDGLAAEAAAEVLARLSRDSLAHCASAQAMEPEIADSEGLASALSLTRIRGFSALAV